MKIDDNSIIEEQIEAARARRFWGKEDLTVEQEMLIIEPDDGDADG